MEYHAGGKRFIHGPKRRKVNQLLSLKHPCWLSLEKYVNMRSMATCSVRYSKSRIRGQKHPRTVVKDRNSIPNIKVNTQPAKIVNIRYRKTSARKGQATTGHPFPRQQTHNYMLRPISRIQIHSYIYIYIFIYIYIIHCIPIGQSQARICPTWSSNISYISFAKSYIGQLADNCPI